MKKNTFIKLLSLALAACLTFVAIPVAVFAQDEAAEKGVNLTSGETVNSSSYDATVEYANSVANGIDAHYIDDSRDGYTVENQNMSLDYYITTDKNVQVASLKSVSGGEYISGTMNAYIKMSDGNVYHTSRSQKDARINIFKHGFYYYDVHVLGQNFGATPSKYSDISASKFSEYSDHITNYAVSNGVVSYTVSGSDPYVYTYYSKWSSLSNPRFKASDYNAIQFTVSATKSTSGQLYFVAGSASGHSSNQVVGFNIKNDGEFHTYTVYINGVSDYKNYVHGIRFDVGDSSTIGENVRIKDVKMVNIPADNPPQIVLDRTFHTYSDKLNQELHFVATATTTGIAEVGMITEIAENTVDALVVKDKNGTHSTLDGVDWASAEYVGFHIKNVGVFGYIQPVHENSGSLMVALASGVYTITQSSVPANGTIATPEGSTANDFRMGQRIYTDENNSFDAFIAEAEIERNPLDAIECSTSYSYDALRGAYVLSIGGTGFNAPFFAEWNKHYSTSATFSGEGADRKIYVCAGFYGGGCVEGAALLDSNNMLLPIPTEVAKNFGGEKEEPIFYAGDAVYSETIFPLSLGAEESLSFTVLNLYQNWGSFPLKQLSSIQYYRPYYHLSVGTTETSCIAPWFGVRDLWTLPDFRSQSMAYWFELSAETGFSNQPQHTHAGYQYFLQYTDADENYNATENVSNVINSSGPVYADVDMTYISDDGNIKVTYKHLEMPQTDELRAYYEIEYEILGNVTINDFANDFSFYSFEGYAGHYRQLGYWAENGNTDGVVHKATNGSDTPEKLVLGNDHPYAALYDLYSEDEDWGSNNANLAFLLYDSEIKIDGVVRNDNFVLVGKNYKYSLSMDIGKVTLRPGDTIKIDMVLSPWGWTDTADDTIVQEIRNNTCLNPLTVTVTEGSKIDSAFLPRIKSTNGNSAEFTLTGGTSNVALRVYGFEKLTAPKIYEKVNGQWVEYKVNSYKTPDQSGYNHSYDGYMVYLDDDGSYSYAFAVDMTDAESRTFRVDASEDFAGWPEDNLINVDRINLYQTPGEICLALGTKKGITHLNYVDNGEYLRFYSDGVESEAFFTVFTGNTSRVTGNYAIIKYRLPSTNSKAVSSFDIFTSTVNTSAQGTDGFSFSGIKNDGEWHVIAVDIAKYGKDSTFAANAAGEYIAKYIRIDVFNSQMAEGDYIDIAYVGMSDSLEDICALNAKHENITLVDGRDNIRELKTADYISKYGDLNSDDMIDARDIMALRKYLTDGSTDYFLGGDADGDGLITAKDLVLLRKYLANYDYDTGSSSVQLGFSN